MNKYRWSIIGPGNIAGKFAESLKLLENAELYSVASRSEGRARKFADEYGFTRACSSYEELINDPQTDIIYIATTNDCHYGQVLDCIEAGKAVICEKPLALNSRQVEALFNKASEKGTFLMEAMWTRFLPAMQKVREILDAGLIGEPSLVQAEFGFYCLYAPEARQFDLQRGGGALLDLGIYPVAFALDILGKNPKAVGGTALLAETGADITNGITINYEKSMAVLSSTFTAATRQEALIYGSKGCISLPAFWGAKEISLIVDGETDKRYDLSFDGPGYQFEAAEVMSCLDAGLTESSLMSCEDSMSVHRIMDELRAQWGIEYPGENF